jgi:putative tryptophan/tyrosine transport system substrate-binding protein
LRWRVRFLRACAVLAAAIWAPHAGAQVLLVLSDQSAGYQSVADEVRAGLKDVREGRLRIDSSVAARTEVAGAAALGNYELVVTIGLAAAQQTLAREKAMTTAPRTLCLLIPRQSFERLLAGDARARDPRLSALFIDQPLSRQMDLLRLALPEKKRVGVILGPTSQAMAGELRTQAREHGLELTVASISERSGLYAALQTVLPASDLLLMLPDPLVASADTVYGLLLTTYREQLPVVGFSEGLLNAGALISLFSTAAQQGRQGAEVARDALQHGGALPEPQYPKYFTVRVNASVARSLGLHLPSEAALGEALKERGEGAHPEPVAGSQARGDDP